MRGGDKEGAHVAFSLFFFTRGATGLLQVLDTFVRQVFRNFISLNPSPEAQLSQHPLQQGEDRTVGKQRQAAQMIYQPTTPGVTAIPTPISFAKHLFLIL